MNYTLHARTWAICATALIVGSLLIGASNTRAQTGTEETLGVLDHFKCYRADGQKIQDLVFLRDQFGAADRRYERDIVGQPRLFCNPTRKVHETAGAVHNVGISNPSNHLTWYDIKPALTEQFRPRKVIVTNQFAPHGQQLTVVKPRFLAVPTQKITVDDRATDHAAPRDLDHFKCYQVEGALLVQQTARLWDQFNLPNVWDTHKVVRPTYLCNPTVKVHLTGFDDNGEPQITKVPILHPEHHLMCYTIQPQTEPVHTLNIDNQFGRQKLTTTQAQLLCVPSEKRVVNPDNPTD